jgi:enoyl-CoA hydratase
VIAVEQEGPVRTVILNNPDKRNALTPELLDAVVNELEAATDDLETSVVILRGAGKGFSAGFALGGPASPDIWADRHRLRRVARRLDAIWECPLPTIACVHGFALAGGADLALHCDLLVVANDARIGYPPVRNLGVPPSNMWLYRLGPEMTKRLLLTGDSITGSEAAELRLAIESCDELDLLGRAMDLAQRMARCGRECLIGNKAVVNRGIDLMGRPFVARLAETEDALGHTSPSAQQFRRLVADEGLRSALDARDRPFDPDPPGIATPHSLESQ